MSCANNLNNGISYYRMGMPFKSSTMTQGSALSNNIITSLNNNGQSYSLPKHTASGSDVIARKRVMAIGSSTLVDKNTPLSFKSNDATLRNSMLQKCRNGGCVAPKKKGMYT